LGKKGRFAKVSIPLFSLYIALFNGKKRMVLLLLSGQFRETFPFDTQGQFLVCSRIKCGCRLAGFSDFKKDQESGEIDHKRYPLVNLLTAAIPGRLEKRELFITKGN